MTSSSHGPRKHTGPWERSLPAQAQFEDFNCETMFNPDDCPPAGIIPGPRHCCRLLADVRMTFSVGGWLLGGKAAFLRSDGLLGRDKVSRSPPDQGYDWEKMFFLPV